ncbi:CCA tRNA nucleotidyltransferase [Clostridium formicaceticum]|uniref:CCA-adding enzyme n=1 Tax=Clostridium formicaceticum TaxID=1497 RepID=A0AAC9WEL9_9CLOT|nr:HDIG domain-containing metalloprotein [Clostridium formicaceticum]AOY75481.1 polynucleotide adenylyltransferase [Clostridium formicaceticum]ARE85768.1 CCA-adding enzyme [Clostridium formicaceticum]
MNIVVDRILQLSKEMDTEIYLVGGTIRDVLLSRKIKDLDFVTLCHPKVLAEKIMNKLEGTLVLLDKEREIYRVVLKDKRMIDFARIKGATIQEDLCKRDFSINAMAYDLQEGWPIKKEKIIDPFGGKRDLDSKKIRHIKEKVFQEDPVRMLRAVAFMAQMKFHLDDRTQALIKKEANRIINVAGERIAGELFKILEEPMTYYYFDFMDKQLNLLEKIFPEIIEMKKIGECKYHVVDSWTHSINTMEIVESYIYANKFFEVHIGQAYEKHTSEKIAGNHSRLQLLKLGALFHDIGKPSARRIDSTGRVRFRGHEITGAELMKEYGDKMRLSVREKEILYKYIYLHMWPLDLYKKNDVSGKTLYDLFNKMGKETLDILLIALGDIVATRKSLDPKEEMGMFKVHIEYMANNYLTRYKPIEDITRIIKGTEVMEALNIPEGSAVGEALEKIRKVIYFGEIEPTKEAAIDYIKATKMNFSDS